MHRKQLIQNHLWSLWSTAGILHEDAYLKVIGYFAKNFVAELEQSTKRAEKAQAEKDLTVEECATIWADTEEAFTQRGEVFSPEELAEALATDPDHVERIVSVQDYVRLAAGLISANVPPETLVSLEIGVISKTSNDGSISTFGTIFAKPL